MKPADIELIEQAAQILDEESGLLRHCHTGAVLGEWPEGEEATQQLYADWKTLATRLYDLAERIKA